jgi:fatty-acid desaturase
MGKHTVVAVDIAKGQVNAAQVLRYRDRPRGGRVLASSWTVVSEEDALTLTWNGHRFDWVNVGYFGTIHAAALTAPWFFSWSALGVCLFLYWLSASVGICLTYHRLLTHRGFRVPKPLEYLFTAFGMLASEGGAITWVAMHRAHHALSDRPGRDLHTPKDGFWWSHIGWILCHLGVGRREIEGRYAPEPTCSRTCWWGSACTPGVAGPSSCGAWPCAS